MANPEQALRRDEIRRVIRTQRVNTQEHLGELLRKAGFAVTQATLSRDLARLGARRVALTQGGTAYELAEAPLPSSPDALSALREQVVSVDASEALVVIRTAPGAASAVALGLDQERVPGILGTLAGDDTIFVATTRGIRPERLAKQLNELWRRGTL